MLHFSIIGNLAADAEVKNFSSGDWVTFRVAHNYKDADGNEKTQWISCSMRGSGGKLLEYLVKGALVFVCGRGAAKTFSSHVTKQWEVGLDCVVDRLELLGSKPKLTIDAISKALDDGTLDAKALHEMLSEKPF